MSEGQEEHIAASILAHGFQNCAHRSKKQTDADRRADNKHMQSPIVNDAEDKAGDFPQAQHIVHDHVKARSCRGNHAGHKHDDAKS